MNKVFLVPVIAACALVACTSDKSTDTAPATTDQAIAGPLPEPANSPASTPAPDSTSTPATPPTSSAASSLPATQPTPTAAPQAATNYPKGTPIPGKPGFVLSPYALYAGQVDVTGFKSGTIVICPYTHKKFVVP